MSLTKRQRMLSAVFLVGLVGLVADRVILRPQGGPRTASAESAVGLPEAAPSSPQATAAQAEGPLARAPVAERLNNLLSGQEASPGEGRDPFSLPLAWSDHTALQGEGTPDVIGTFVRRHQLNAVVVQGGETCALVDDRFLVRGQTIDGFQLISVSDRSAVFERDGKQATLNLAGR